MNDLTLSERERITILAEECSEVIKECAKLLRHGWKPVVRETTYDNKQALEIEVGHVQSAVTRCFRNQDLNPIEVQKASAYKDITAKEYLHHHHE